MRAFPAVLTIAAIVAGCSKQPAPNVFVDPALATIVPSDTVFLAGIRVQQLHPTPIYQKYILQGKLPLVEEFAKETGIDPRKDLWEVLITSDGRSSVVMLRGKFAEMGMEPRINRADAVRMGYKGYTMLGNERAAVAFLNPTTAVAGSVPALKSIIDQRNTTSGIPAYLSERIKLIPSTNQIWFVGNVAGRVPSLGGLNLGQAAPLALLAQSVRMISGAADFRSGLTAAVTANTTTADAARRLKEAIRGLIGFGRLNTPEDHRQLLQLYDGVKAENKGESVQIDVEIAADLLDELVRLAGQAGIRRQER